MPEVKEALAFGSGNRRHWPEVQLGVHGWGVRQGERQGVNGKGQRPLGPWKGSICLWGLLLLPSEMGSGQQKRRSRAQITLVFLFWLYLTSLGAVLGAEPGASWPVHPLGD